MQRQRLIHGGDIATASHLYGIAMDEWLDLSTGINPDAYPCAGIPDMAFQQLPYAPEGFQQCVAEYYGSDSFVTVPGTQSVIQQLPDCLPQRQVLLPQAGYAEHEQCWVETGVKTGFYDALNKDRALAEIEASLQQNPDQHVVVINPNNPTGLLLTPDELESIADRLGQGCYLIIDEAFIDLTPQQSVLAGSRQANMIVLRSFGKFFGLAGIRLGFVFADDTVLQPLQKKTGLWSVGGPAQYLAMQALADVEWQQQAQENIADFGDFTHQLLKKLIEPLEPQSIALNGLFNSYLLPTAAAEQLQRQLAEEAILVRLIPFDEQLFFIRIGAANPVKRDVVEHLRYAVRQIAQGNSRP